MFGTTNQRIGISFDLARSTLSLITYNPMTKVDETVDIVARNFMGCINFVEKHIEKGTIDNFYFYQVGENRFTFKDALLETLDIKVRVPRPSLPPKNSTPIPSPTLRVYRRQESPQTVNPRSRTISPTDIKNLWRML